MYFVEVEDEIEFADVSEVFVQDLNETLHELKDYQFILVFVDDGDEVQTCESLIYYFVFLVI